MLRFRCMRSLQKFAAVRVSISNLKRFDFNLIYHIKSKRPLRLDVAPRFCSNPVSGLSRNALFNAERSLTSRLNFKLKRAAALAAWRGLCAE